VQGSFSPDGETALVSTTEAAVLLGVRSGLHPRVGSKPREGAYGGCFHRGAARAAVRLGLVDPAEAGRSSDDDDAGSTKSPGEGGGGGDAGRARWMLAARPGRRLWVAEARVDSDGVPISRVVSTLRPEMIPPTDAPGSPAYARTPVASSEGSAAPKTQKPRRWEFGEIRALGEFCAVSVSARAIAVAELAGASLLAWFPTGDAAPPDAALLILHPEGPHTIDISGTSELDPTLAERVAFALDLRAQRLGQVSIRLFAWGSGSPTNALRARGCAASLLGLQAAYLNYLATPPSQRGGPDARALLLNLDTAGDDDPTAATSLRGCVEATTRGAPSPGLREARTAGVPGLAARPRCIGTRHCCRGCLRFRGVEARGTPAPRRVRGTTP